LLGVPEVKLDLEPQRVVFDQGLGGQGQVVAEQQHLGAAPGLQVGFHDDGDIEQFREVLVPRPRLVDAGADVFFRCLCLQVRLRQRFQRQPFAVFAPPAFIRILAGIGEVQLGVMAQLGGEVQRRLGDIQIDTDPFQRGTDAALQLGLERRQSQVLPAFVGAALGPAPLGAFLLAGRGHHDLVAGQQPHPRCPDRMLLDESPAQRRPRDFSPKKTLHRPIAAALFGPAGQSQQGDAPGHRQHGLVDEGELFQCAPVQVWTRGA
jgi:hypothetical protein